MHRRTQHGAHLGTEHDRFGVAQADAGQPQCGIQRAVGCAARAEPARVFVHAQIHRADGERLAFQFFGNIAIQLVQLFFFGQAVAVQIGKLRTQQTHAVRTDIVQRFHIVRTFDIGEQFDFFAIQCGGGGFFDFVQRAQAAAVMLQPQTVFRQHQFVRVDNQHALNAVHNHPFVLANQLPRIAHADNGRNVQAAAQNGGVAGGAADVGHETFDALVFEKQRIGGGQIVGDENRVVQQVGIQIQLGALPGQIFLNPLHHLQHVLFALAQVFVINFVKLLA